MESCFLAVILLSSFAVNACHLGITDWDDVVVAREDMPTTLVCTDTTVSGAVTINWMVKSLGADEWKLVLSASEKDQFYGGASKSDMQLADPKFHDTGVFSLSLLAKLEDRGLYSCLIKQQERQLKERKILLAILKVSVVPAAPVPLYSTLRLIASINPDNVATKISWAAPGGISIKSEKWPGTGTVAKLPEVRSSDDGVYACTVHLWGNCSSSSFTFDVNVTVDAYKLASFTNITHGLDISATQAQTSCPLTCPSVPGDYVVVRWRPPDIRKNSSMRIVHQYDRWRGSTLLTEQRRLQLAGPPYNADTGSFSYLLIPEIKDGGLYVCTVYLNDVAISKMTLLSVLKVRTRRLPSKLELLCQYSEHIQVQSASWKYQNRSRQLRMSSNGPGSVTTSVSLPITRDTAGNYTCTLTLKNGQTIWATQVVTLASEELVSATTSSLLPSLSALLLLVPLVAAGVLLWRQKHISDRGIQQSLSVHSGEVENIYENPEDIRQAPPQGSVYMDLKPREEDDVYKELERYEQCHN